MKLKVLLVTLAIISVASTAEFGQTKKSKKKQQIKDAPVLKVVQPQQEKLHIPVPEPQKPTNGSLYTDNAVNANLLRDFKARQIGDLVFVDVVETSTATVSSDAKRSRDSGTIAGAAPVVAALPINGVGVVGDLMTGLGQRKFEGTGTTGRTSVVKSRIAARVIEVLPNGDLRIEAVKMVKVNAETEQLAVTGLVRQNDLASDNSVQTTMVGDLRVEYNGKGVASADNAPGWLFKFFDKINPF